MKQDVFMTEEQNEDIIVPSKKNKRNETQRKME